MNALIDDRATRRFASLATAATIIAMLVDTNGLTPASAQAMPFQGRSARSCAGRRLNSEHPISAA